MKHLKTPSAPAPKVSAPQDGCTVTRETLTDLGQGDAVSGEALLRQLIRDEISRKPVNGPTARPPNVRAATEADEAGLFELLMLDMKESALAVAKLDVERIMMTVTMGTRRRGGILGVIDGPDGKPVAAMLLVPVQWWWSRGYYLQEVFLFVHPEHRKSRHAEALIRFEKWLCDNWSAQFGYQIYLLAGVTSGQKTRQKMRLYGRHLNPVGGFYVYPAIPEGATV